MQESETVIDLMRHGEPVGGRCYRGNNIDDPLSELGWQQMKQSAAQYSDWQQIICSPLIRCRAFADFLADQRHLPIRVMEDFKEVGFGSWEGKTPDQIQQDSPTDYQSFFDDPVRQRPAGAEPLDDFSQRVIAGFKQVATEYAGQHVVIIAHAGVIRAVLGYVLQAPAENWYRAKITNAGVSRFRKNTLGYQLEFHNRL